MQPVCQQQPIARSRSVQSSSPVVPSPPSLCPLRRPASELSRCEVLSERVPAAGPRPMAAPTGKARAKGDRSKRLVGEPKPLPLLAPSRPSRRVRRWEGLACAPSCHVNLEPSRGWSVPTAQHQIDEAPTLYARRPSVAGTYSGLELARPACCCAGRFVYTTRTIRKPLRSRVQAMLLRTIVGNAFGSLVPSARRPKQLGTRALSQMRYAICRLPALPHQPFDVLITDLHTPDPGTVLRWRQRWASPSSTH